jgi:hypothetical protein
MALLKVSCISCGHEIPVAAGREGCLLRCQLCGATVRAPAAPRPDDPFWRDPGFAQHPPTAVERASLLLGLFSGLGCIISAGVIVFARAVPTQDIDAPEAVWVQGGLLLGLAAGYALLGLIYLFGGLNIRNGGAMSAMLVLALGPLHLAFLAANLQALLALPRNGPGSAVLRYATHFTALEMGILGAYLLVSLLSLVTHSATHRTRAGWLFAVLGTYGFLAFAGLFALAGYIILSGTPPALPPRAAYLTDRSAMVYASAALLTGATLLWLLAVSVRRTTYFGPIAGLIVTLPLATGGAWNLALIAPALVRQGPLAGGLMLGGMLFSEFLLVGLIYLLIRALGEVRAQRAAPAGQPDFPWAMG